MPTGQKNEHGGGAKGIKGCLCELCVERKRLWRKESRRRNAESIRAYNIKYAKENPERIKACNDRNNAINKAKLQAKREVEGWVRVKPTPPVKPLLPHGGGLTGRAGCLCELCRARKRQYNRDRAVQNPDYGKVDHACSACGKNYFGLPRTKHPECRSTGYRTARPGVFYLLYNEVRGEFKGGICNQGSTRVEEFSTHGFLPLIVFEAEDGWLPKSVESDFHRHCRELILDNPYDARTCPGGKRGYTEIYSLISSHLGTQYTIEYFEDFANKLIREISIEESLDPNMVPKNS